MLSATQANSPLQASCCPVTQIGVKYVVVIQGLSHALASLVVILFLDTTILPIDRKETISKTNIEAFSDTGSPGFGVKMKNEAKE